MLSPTQLALLVPVASSAVWFLYHFFLIPRIHRLNALPGPPPKSIISGNAKDMVKFAWSEEDPYPGVYGKWLRTYGPAYHLRLLHFHTVVLADPDALKHVFVSRADNYIRHATQRGLYWSFTGGAGVLTTEGDVHAAQRKMLNPHFGYVNLKTFVRIFNTHAAVFASRLASLADGNTVLDLHERMTKLSFDIIGLAAFGYAFKSQENESVSILDAFEALNMTPTFASIYGHAYIPGFEHLPLPFLRKRKAAKAVLAQVVDDVIARKLAASAESANKDLLDLVLESDENMTPHEARVHVLTFLLAGHETTSTSLAWVLALLAQHPAVAAAVADECRRVLAKAGDDGLSWDDLGELKYLKAVINETQRLQPTAGILTLHCVADDLVPRADAEPFFLPAGSRITLHIGATHRNPQYWSRPDEFLPERFLEGSALFAADKDLQRGRSSTYFFLPFSNGPRSCIGSRFAIAEMLVVLTHALARYDFRLDVSANTHAKIAGLTYKPTKLAMTVVPRTN
ncbi:hypothetical protein SDRG_06707 [Saprolegnia diclina VS20]|uniref:Cytochrome P450 n=1 Tax=Saprolegnia diclina (strain VS20) TaxID=1156394 RepID=T0QQ57_SAPDV|nr:hypothetical protein SDRG_06707 [Saprolegnia diclina VS20]EQC35965.1 hypothetical protein SDRG_06707 [Saprolegnia diclina VS20]|eukprot:XP_008610727.1 hypothetical protein SDRG_06707 [Saprolegnia diclina VS20]